MITLEQDYNDDGTRVQYVTNNRGRVTVSLVSATDRSGEMMQVVWVMTRVSLSDVKMINYGSSRSNNFEYSVVGQATSDLQVLAFAVGMAAWREGERV